MKTLKLSFAILLFLVVSNSVFAQTADEIISNYITTIGGAEKLKALKGVKMEMTLNQGMEIPIDLVQLSGGKMYMKLNIQGKEITQMASNGAIVWNTNFQSMKAEKADAETTANAILSNEDFPDPMLDYKAKGYSAEYIGKETKEGTECFKVKFTKKPISVDGIKVEDVTYYYFDTENSLPILSETEIKQGPQKGQKSISTMSDYQEVDGIYFPYAMTMFGTPIKVNKVTLNPVVEDSKFEFKAE